MLRHVLLASAGLTLLSFGAMAQSSAPDQPPPPSSQSAPSQYDGPGDEGPGNQADAARYQSDDIYCRRDAAARTGYRSPGQAASDAQTSGTVGGTVLGAAAGALIGGASGHAGTGAAIGAGAGLLAGSAVGADNARAAANQVEQQYAAAYYQCMAARDGTGRPGSYSYNNAPPPPDGYDSYAYGHPYPYPGYAYPPYPYYYPAPYYYGPAVTFGFGFGGYRGYHGGFHHR